jgi:hypothetical protein
MPNTVGHRLAVVVGVASLLLPAAGCGGHQAAPTAEAGSATCPATFADQQGQPANRTGDLVPASATQALLCVYPFPGKDAAAGYRLDRSVPAGGSPDDVVRYLNRLSRPDSGATGSCTLMGHNQYQIVLGYTGGTHTLVHIDYNCGTVFTQGAVRRVDQMDKLLALWPR